MDPVLELTLALLASVGLLCLGWILFDRLLMPAGEECAPLWMVVCGRGKGEELEQTMRLLHRKCVKGKGNTQLILLDLGMDKEGRMRAELLQRRWPELEICLPEELAERIT